MELYIYYRPEHSGIRYYIPAFEAFYNVDTLEYIPPDNVYYEPLMQLKDSDVERMTSEPIYINTLQGDGIVTYKDGGFVPIYLSNRNLFTDQILDAHVFRVPNINGVTQRVERLPRIDLPRVPRLSLDDIKRMLDEIDVRPTDEETSQEGLGPEETGLYPSLSPEQPLPESALITLIKQLYGIPVNVSDSGFITYDEAVNLLNTGHVSSYLLEPLLQPLAGPPESPNRIVSLYTKAGERYLVKVVYNQFDGKMSRPV